MTPPRLPLPRNLIPELEGFVRETLGCTCPAEVFDQVEDAPAERLGVLGIDRRIAIGGRLLIYLVCAPAERAADWARSRMLAWINAGLVERDALVMNRLRVVIVLEHASTPLKAAIEAAFDAASAQADDRVHLHLVEAAILPSWLLSGPAASPVSSAKDPWR